MPNDNSNRFAHLSTLSNAATPAPAPTEEIQATSLRLPKSLHTKFKAKCAAEERGLHETMQALIRLWVDGQIDLPDE